MALIGEMFALVNKWQILLLTVCFLITLWLLTGGLREWLKKEWNFLQHAALMDGPTAIPIIGNALIFACSYNEILPRLIKLAKPYENPFRFWLGTKLVIGVKNPRDIEVVMTSSVAANKPYEYRHIASYMGLGVATGSGPAHRASRKLFMPTVNGKALNTFFDTFDQQSRRCVECLEERVDTGEFDIIHYMDNCTLDIILESIMGTPGSAQDGGYKGLMTCSARAFGAAYERTAKVWLYLDWIYNRTRDGKEYASDMDVLHNFTDSLIAKKKQEHLESGAISYSEEGPAKPVLDRLIAHDYSKDMDYVRLRDEITNIWMPAQDPTALTSSFLFVMLGMHPEVQDKVRAEVREVIGDGDLTLEHIPKLKYLEMVFKETVRLFPVGPVILREPHEDLEFKTCTAPKGCTIALFVFATHRDPKHWTEPDKFIPERFTPENSAGRHPFAFVPFSYGIRGCVGRNYATMLMKTLVARVVMKYKISAKGNLDTLKLKAGVSIRAVEGYNVSITRV